MIISPHEYLALTDQIAFLTEKTNLYETQNKKLSEEIVKQCETIRMLNEQLQSKTKQEEQYTQKFMEHVVNTNGSVIAQVNLSSQEQIKKFEQEIEKIKKDANIQKVRQIERKMTENRLINHEMVDFYQKIQSLYMVINKTKNAPNMAELYKWISIRKAEELNCIFPTYSNIGGTQKTIFTNKSPNSNKSKTVNNGSKTSILKPNASKAKLNSTDEIASAKKAEKRKKSNKQNEESNTTGKNKKKVKIEKPITFHKQQENTINILSTESLTQNKIEHDESFTVDVIEKSQNKAGGVENSIVNVMV